MHIPILTCMCVHIYMNKDAHTFSQCPNIDEHEYTHTTHTYMHAYPHSHICVPICTWAHVYTQRISHTFPYICEHTYTHACTHRLLHMCPYIYMSTHVHHRYTHAHTHTLACVCVYVSTHIHMHVPHTYARKHYKKNHGHTTCDKHGFVTVMVLPDGPVSAHWWPWCSCHRFRTMSHAFSVLGFSPEPTRPPET